MPETANCTATFHNTFRAFNAGCRCPRISDVMSAVNRRRSAARRGIGRGPATRRSRDPHVDPIAVERACHGDPVPLTVRERGLAIERLRQQGLSIVETAVRLHVAPRTVSRHRGGHVASVQSA